MNKPDLETVEVSPILRKQLLTILPVVLAAVPTAQAANILDDILSPLRGVSLGQLYLDYSSIWDFALFLILFLGIARIAFARRFEARGAKALTIA
ncbi:hypothetical protein ACFL6C_10625, partial [Myxococcota bacterium]